MMAQTATLHIKVEPTIARELKQVAIRRHVSVGELVRQAVQACYQTEWLGLTVSQHQALEAYRGGYIGLGKLAEAMGLPVLKTREWLNECGIAQNTLAPEEDLSRA
jgi:hypothetical protein